MDKDIPARIKVISIPETATIQDALQAIDRGALGVAFIVDNSTGVFRGLLTDGDIRRSLLSGMTLSTSIQQIPRQTEVVVGYAEMSAEELASRFSERIRVLPILDSNQCVVDIAIYDRRARIPVAEPYMDSRELEYVTDCIVSGWVSSAGKYVTRFEEVFAEFCQVNYAVATSNGTAGLHLALLGSGIGEGDEVIIPSLTFIATANAVRYTGATPVIVDVEPETWAIDPNMVEKAITSKTRAVIPVHLYGHPADMDPLLDIAERHNLIIIEDAAEAHGARYKGRLVGGIGSLGVFSFYGNKIVTTGEGGMVVTNDASVANQVRLLRDHGMSPERRYWHPIMGYNYRLTNLQAALGVAQMEKIEQILALKRHIAKRYTKGLENIPGITPPPNAGWADNVFWLYCILVNPEEYGKTRRELMGYLGERNIETRPFFPPIHSQPIYKSDTRLPVSEYLYDVGLSLPSAVSLTDAELDRVVALIKGDAE